MISLKPVRSPNDIVICVLGAAFLVAGITIPATAQKPSPSTDKNLPVVAILVGNRPVLDWIVTGLRDIGYVAERNFPLEARLTEGRADKEAQFADGVIR